VEKLREIFRRRENFLEDVRKTQGHQKVIPMLIAVGKPGQWRLSAGTVIRKNTDTKIVSLRKRFSVSGVAL